MTGNWYEMYAFGRERAAELTRLAASIRTERQVSRLQSRKVQQAPGPAAAQELFSAARDAGRARATFVMERGEVLSIRVGRRPYRISCVAGRLWATMDGSTVDSMLVAGESLAYRGRGKVVVQALRTATVRIEYPNAARVILGSSLRPALQLTS
jgi:hypothetical protein